jgi:glutamyl-tRNA synthetase
MSSISRPYRGRFAPSPTGELHLGSAATAIFCVAMAKRACGAVVLRIEDLDRARAVPHLESHFADVLGWLGLAFDESPELGGPTSPYRQSDRLPLYQRALANLRDAAMTYLCDCSRADIALVAEPPNALDDGPRYPGTCRDKPVTRSFRRPPAERLRVPSEHRDDVDDFVLARGDGTMSYHLATTVDDLVMEITEVVRGADLATSAPRQALIARLLGGVAPAYVHVPVLVEADGSKLAKRARSASIGAYREQRIDPRALVRAIAAAYGHGLSGHDPLADLYATVDPSRFPASAVRLDRIALPRLSA